MSSMIPIYRTALSCAVKIGIIDSGVAIGSGIGITANSTADIALETFRSLAGLKDELVRLMLPMEVSGTSIFGQYHPSILHNDVIRIQAISLIESVIILHSRRLPNSEIPRANEGDISLDQIPALTNTQLQSILEASTAASSATLLPGVCLVRPHRLAEEAERLFAGLSSWPVRGKPSVTAGSVTCPVVEAVMDSLVNIAKQRPQFMDRVVQAFETVHVTLPPHFSDNQVSSVRKKLKNGLLQLLRHPAAVSDFQGRITILLTDLGATQAEVLQALQSHTELSRSRLYPDPSTFMVSRTGPVSLDHGDVDMRQQQQQQQQQQQKQQLLHQQSIPSVTQASSSTVVSTTSHSSNIPPTDMKLSFSSSQSQATSSTTAAATTPSTTAVTTSTDSTFTESAKLQTESTSSQKDVPTTSGGFTLAEAEAALRFDDDDDDDEDDDDIQIPRTSRRLRKKKRRSSTTTTTNNNNNTGNLTPSGSGNKLTTSKTGSTDVKSQVPEVDMITSRIVPKLTTANVADLVLLSMVTLPDQMPASFQSTYTPIAAAGTSAQIRHLARMLAVQLSVWAGEGGQYEVADRINQLETLLIPVDDVGDDRGDSQSMRKRNFKSEPRTSEQGSDIQKESAKSKKRRLHMLGDQTSAENDPEAEDAVIRANAARKMHTAQTMNISTLVGYGTQQQQMINESLDMKMLPPGGVPGMMPMFTGQNTMSLPPTMPPNMLMPGFNPSQPPPPIMPMMMPPGMMPPPQTPSQAAAAAAAASLQQHQQQPTVMPGQAALGKVSFNQYSSSTIPMPQADSIVPSSVRPFSLDAVTAFLSRDVQRQLARDAFMRIIEGLETPYTRHQSLHDGTIVPTPAGTDLITGQYDVNRMKILTRLTTRRFGGNEFYNILIDHAIQNLRYGFELLSKLLMQEYCRFRGFQLSGFSTFLDGRRHQLSVLREQIRKRLESSIENDCNNINNNNNNSSEKLSKADDNDKSMLSETNEDAANTDASDNHEKTIEGDTSRQDMSTDEISHEDEKHKKKSNNNNNNRKRKTSDDNPMKPKCTDDDEPVREEGNDEDDAVANTADGDEEPKSSLPNSSPSSSSSASLKDTSRRQSKRSKKEVSGDMKPSSKDKLSILKTPVAPPDDLGCLSFYDCLLITILQKLSNPEIRQHYFGRFLMEAPLITPGAINELKRYCSSPEQATYGFEILRTLIETRPITQREDLLNMLLHFCSVDGLEVRKAALIATRELANSDSRWQEHIEMFAVQMLKKLLQPRPTADIFPFLNHASIPSTWTDEACQACAHLFLGLMPQSPSLMHKLAEVYTQASPNIKRCLLRMVDSPIRDIGIYSVDLQNLVDECPNGAETLITRMIHILTDSPSAVSAASNMAGTTTNSSSVTASTPAKTHALPHSPPPSAQTQTSSLSAATTPSTVVGPGVIVPPPSLVSRVYRLYEEKVHDVRCLIPVIVGLTKQQVIAALPKLVQLNEKVVKEVLHRLLHASVSTQYAPVIKNVKNIPFDPTGKSPPPGPLKPEELLVAVHLLEFARDPTAQPLNEGKPTKPYVNLQSILHACRVCFSERRLFTQERLSVAIGQLLEQPVLPTLFMRTVMQALALHPRLTGYVINVLVRLIRKQVWKSEKLWDGFIRCCVKTRPQSYQVLLQLPPDRLEAVFRWEPAMRAQVRRYVENFSSAQRIDISKAIVEVLEHVPTPPRVPTPEDQSKPDNVVVVGGGDGDGGVGDADGNTTEVKEPNTTTQSGNNSPTSSGPGTPTRDEMSHYDAAPSFIPAGMFNQPATNIPVMNIDTATSSGIDNQYHQIPSLLTGSKTVIQQTAGSYNSPSSSQSNLLKTTTTTAVGTITTTPLTTLSDMPGSGVVGGGDDTEVDPTVEELFEADYQCQSSSAQQSQPPIGERSVPPLVDEYDMNHSPPQITMDISHQLKKNMKSKPALVLQEMDNDQLDFEENSDPISESDASNPQIHQHSYYYRHHHKEQQLDKEYNVGGDGDIVDTAADDDGEPPILPASRIDSLTATTTTSSSSSSASLKRWRESEDTVSMLNKQIIDERSQDVLQTNPSSGITPTGGGTIISISRGKRPVDVNKLEADRKRLEEEAVKYKQLKAERRQQHRKHQNQPQQQQQQHQQSSSGTPGSE
ncbi:unnamed protein product [Trichobilharzia szidati]|nr:unnamed protein product [Trichobilharzia szidati]